MWTMAEVLIKGFKMPENCWSCPFLHTSEHYVGDDKILQKHTCLRTGESTYEYLIGYLKNCPLIEIPPHGRLIDADKLEKAEEWRKHGIINQETVNAAPTIIPASKEVENGKV